MVQHERVTGFLSSLHVCMSVCIVRSTTAQGVSTSTMTALVWLVTAAATVSGGREHVASSEEMTYGSTTPDLTVFR